MYILLTLKNVSITNISNFQFGFQGFSNDAFLQIGVSLVKLVLRIGWGEKKKHS